MSQPIEFQRLYDDVLNSKALQASPSLTALFKYLWPRRDDLTPTIEIWHDVLYDYSKSKLKDESKEAYDYDRNVRERCGQLREALRTRNENVPTSERIDLPDAQPGLGYQLRTPQLKGRTLAFWQAHLAGTPEISIVYVEQLFYEYWPERFAIRYWDCDQEDPEAALSELRERHPLGFRPGMIATYPFIASGEIEARDLIVKWFSVNALVEARTAISRRTNDRNIWDSSLVLFGGAPGHRMIVKALQSCPNLDIWLKQGWTELEGKLYGEARLKHPSKDEMRKFGPYHPVCSESKCTLHFSPDEGTAMAILTRMRNPYSNTAITIINSDFGRAVEQIGHLITNEKRMSGREWPDMPRELPESFQVLFGIPVPSLSDDHLLARQIEPLAWRSYS